VVLELAARFYDHMDLHEPALARLHRLDPAGRVHPESRERFGLFLIGWLGGPQEYVQRHGHPRLRMRHGAVPIGETERDAWMRCMRAAMDDLGLGADVRSFLDARFADVADFLRNRPG
jgi:hemoglobin